MKRSIGLLLLLLTGTACAVHPERPPAATPQRPTVSANAQTTAYESIELEAGVSVDPSDVLDSPMRLKFGLGERTEGSVALSPLIYINRPGDDAHGVGDLVFATKHRLLDQDGARPAFAFELATKLPTASEVEGIGSGEIDFFAVAIASGDYDDVSLTAYYRFGALGAPGASGVDGEHVGAFAASTALGKGFGAFGEIAGLFDDERKRDEVFTTLGATHQPLPNLVFDAGIIVGLSDDAPDFAVVAGLTLNFGRLVRTERYLN